MSVRIREANSADWPAVWRIISEVAEEGTTFAMERRPDEVQERASWMIEPPGRVVVAVEDGRVLGTANMYANRPNQGSHVASGSFMVASGSRGRGVGRAMARDMIEWAGEKGFAGIQFNAVVATNEGALRLYESEGFRVVGAAPGAFRHPGEGDTDLLVLWRDLP